MIAAATHETWWQDGPAAHRVVRNVIARSCFVGTEIVVGLFLMPFNLHHLGKEAYGLWLLTASVMAYFSVLDLGYGSALVKFVAQYRTLRQPRAINEIVSTLFFVYAAVGTVAYLCAVVVAFNMGRVFPLSADQAALGRDLLLMTGLYVALGFPFGVYGAVMNGFQRYDENSVVAIVMSVTVAIINVWMLTAGYGLRELVAATTLVRIASLLVYRANAHRAFPPLHVRPTLISRVRLREVTGFSVYSMLIDFAQKLNYSADPAIVAAFLGNAAVAMWGVAERITSATQRTTNQLNTVLFPLIVDSDASQSPERLRNILVVGTRVSIAMVAAVTVPLLIFAHPLVRSWVGPGFESSAQVLQVLAVAIAFRVSQATSMTLLKGAGRHRFVAWTNLATGATNIAFSIVLIQRLGLVGEAWGTLIPLAAVSMFVAVPAACRRTGLPVGRFVARAVAPALWPALGVSALLLVARPYVPVRLFAVGVVSAAAAAVYVVVFALTAVDANLRRQYIRRAREAWSARVVWPQKAA